MRQTLAFMLISLSFTGCLLSVPVGPDSNKKTDDNTPAVKKITAADTFEGLAQSIDDGVIKTSTRLAEVVNVHQRAGWLSDTDVTKFDTAFPELGKTQRDLTKADAATLRGIK